MLIDPVWFTFPDVKCGFAPGTVCKAEHTIHYLKEDLFNPSLGKNNEPLSVSIVRWVKWNPFIPGIYWAWQIEHDIEDITNYKVIHEWEEYPWEKVCKISRERDWNPEEYEKYSIARYGVADTVEQVINHFRSFINDSKEKYIISIFEIRKTEMPDWRWHKWGEYIGKQEPQCEHIGDEPEIEKVIRFQIHHLDLK